MWCAWCHCQCASDAYVYWSVHGSTVHFVCVHTGPAPFFRVSPIPVTELRQTIVSKCQGTRAHRLPGWGRGVPPKVRQCCCCMCFCAVFSPFFFFCKWQRERSDKACCACSFFFINHVSLKITEPGWFNGSRKLPSSGGRDLINDRLSEGKWSALCGAVLHKNGSNKLLTRSTFPFPSRLPLWVCMG